MANSINTNIAAYFAQQNIGKASAAAQTSVSRLSSGNFITKASDDVARLSIGTSFSTTVRTLKQALVNASQGVSLLQVADGALGQVTELLQRQKTLAVQASSGNLSNTDRGFLNQEFQALTQQIDFISQTASFNGVNLLNGSLSTTSTVTSNASDSAKSEIRVTALAWTAGQTLILNGVTVTGATSPSGAGDFQHASTIAQTLDNLVAYLNDPSGSNLSAANKLLIGKASYAREGNTLVITSRAGGDLSEFYRVDNGLTTTSAVNGTSNVVVTGGKGGELITNTNALAVANIDSDISTGATGITTVFAEAAITHDGVTVATVADGDSLRSIMNKVNATTSTTGVSAFITGSSNAYVLSFRTTTTAATGAVVNTGNTGITFTAATANTIMSLDGGGASGLGQGSTIGIGSTGGSFSILTDQTQQYARSVISFPEIAAGDLTNSTNFGTARDITIEGQVFTFTQTAKTAKAQSEITIGSTLQETLDNAVEAINSFYGTAQTNYALQQIQARREGNSIVIESKLTGNALDIDGNALTVATTSSISGTSVSSANLSNASNNGGIDASGVMNDAFVGVITGFEGSYSSANTVDLSITVGGITYSADGVTTNPTSDTEVRFYSDNGGYFSATLRKNQGVAVSSSADVDTFVKKLDAAFAGVTFSQKRDISTYSPSGNLLGSSFKLQASDFEGVKLEGLSVSAPAGSNPNGSISFTLNGETYTSQSALGTQLGAYSITRFVSASDANKYLEFKNGATALSLASAEDAKTLETNLKQALGVTEGASSLSFQIGTSASESLGVSIASASTSTLFNGQVLSIGTLADASAASDAIDAALATVTSIRASVGALQSRFNFASANIQISVQNQDASRSELLDTDIAAESTSYATAQVQLQAGISVLAQANQQLQSLLKLLG